MSAKPKVEVQYEVCKSCNGTGRNFLFSHFGQSKPKLMERLCGECYGLCKRPILAGEEEPQAVAVSTPEEKQDMIQKALAAAEKHRAEAAQKTMEEALINSSADSAESLPPADLAHYEGDSSKEAGGSR
jgi:hypothetical protein